jgi:hypothetical protein
VRTVGEIEGGEERGYYGASEDSQGYFSILKRVTTYLTQ